MLKTIFVVVLVSLLLAHYMPSPLEKVIHFKVGILKFIFIPNLLKDFRDDLYLITSY